MEIKGISMDDHTIVIEINKKAYCKMIIREYESILYRINDFIAENYDENKYNTYDDVEDIEYDEFDYKELYKLIDENKHEELTDLITEHKHAIVKLLPYLSKFETSIAATNVVYKDKIDDVLNMISNLYIFIINNNKNIIQDTSFTITCLRQLHNMIIPISKLLDNDRHYIYLKNHYDSYY